MTKVTKASLSSPKINWLVEPTYDEDGVQRTAGLDELGREHGDPVPHNADLGLTTGTGDTLHATLRQLVRDEMFRRAVEEEGFESFEESDDFDVEDDMFPVDPQTPYEAVFDPPAQRGGESPTLASEAPNGKGGPPTKPPTQPSRTVSSDSSSESSTETTVEKPKDVDTRGHEVSSYSESQARPREVAARSMTPGSDYRLR